jgi:hypothetical protein
MSDQNKMGGTSLTLEGIVPVYGTWMTRKGKEECSVRNMYMELYANGGSTKALQEGRPMESPIAFCCDMHADGPIRPKVL